MKMGESLVCVMMLRNFDVGGVRTDWQLSNQLLHAEVAFGYKAVSALAISGPLQTKSPFLELSSSEDAEKPRREKTFRQSSSKSVQNKQKTAKN